MHSAILCGQLLLAFLFSNVETTTLNPCQSKAVTELQKIRKNFNDLEQRLLDIQAQVSQCGDSGSGYPTGWVWAPLVRKYYRVLFELVDWDTADSRCRELGSKSHLVVVNDTMENQAIRQLLAALDPRMSRICDAPRVLYADGYGGYWTSGQRADRTQCGSTPWVWKPYPGVSYPVTFTDWANGQPTCSWGTEHCFHYGTDVFDNYKWNDLNCAWPACPLCELEV
jgi:hypothetical protein